MSNDLDTEPGDMDILYSKSLLDLVRGEDLNLVELPLLPPRIFRLRVDAVMSM